MASCERCTWWEKYFDGDEFQQPLGACMRHPPTARSTVSSYCHPDQPKSSTVYLNDGIFPSTTPEDYCGEHDEVDDYIED